MITMLLFLTQCYSSAMHLDRWDFDVSFVANTDAYAATLADTIYQIAEIEYDTLNLQGKNEVFLRRTVIHELLHVLLWDLAEEGDLDTEEQTISSIDRWPLWQRMCPLPE